MTSVNIEWWPSPAKINLFLHICGQYENGYHSLQTLFQLLDFGDEIGIEINESEKVEIIDGIEGVSNADNLIFKAAQLLIPHRPNKKLGAKIHLRKRIPMGGGLGGGSSNAATVLIALNHMWQCKLQTKTLLELGVKLGADVPVFINGHSAFAQGIGDDLQNIQIEDAYYLVATPKTHISTESIFTHPDLPRNTPIIDFSDYKFDQTHNDCEKLVCKLQPEVANLVTKLIHYAPSRMTGTGASVFAKFASQNVANKVINHLPEGVSAFVAKGVNISPLLTKLIAVQSKTHL